MKFEDCEAHNRCEPYDQGYKAGYRNATEDIVEFPLRKLPACIKRLKEFDCPGELMQALEAWAAIPVVDRGKLERWKEGCKK